MRAVEEARKPLRAKMAILMEAVAKLHRQELGMG